VLTDDEIDQIDGRQEELLGKLQEKYGYTRADAQRRAGQFLTEMELRRLSGSAIDPERIGQNTPSRSCGVGCFCVKILRPISSTIPSPSVVRFERKH